MSAFHSLDRIASGVQYVAQRFVLCEFWSIRKIEC